MQGIYKEDKRIKAIEQWPKYKLVKNIQVFFRFANFYWQFIQSFSCITILLTSMLKIIKSIRSTANPKNTKGKASGNWVVGNNMINGSKITIPKSSIKKIWQKKLSPKF